MGKLGGRPKKLNEEKVALEKSFMQILKIRSSIFVKS